MRKNGHPWANRSMLQGIYFTLCLNEQQFKSACRQMNTDADFDLHHEGTTYHFENGGKGASVVVIRNWEGRERNAVLGLIVHEAVHVWQETKRIIGEKCPGNEIEAYAIQNITQELFDLFDILSATGKGASKRKAK